MLKLYTDRKQTFECKINIEGAQLSNAKARLMLSGVVMDYAFPGRVDAMGNCNVELPPLKMIENKEGTATLEVMVDGGYFEPLKIDYKLLSRKVTVENITVKDRSFGVKVHAEEVKKSIIKEEPKKVKSSIFLESCSDDDIKIVKETLEGFKKLPKKHQRVLREQVQFQYKPSKKVLSWAKGVFKNINSGMAKTVMYEVENILQ